jgi:valyl-tRNA synthetase
MDKVYQPQAMEKTIYQRWEKEGYFTAKLPSSSSQESYGEAWSLMIPPPNVTGSLHMGHAFQDTIMDCLTRYHRMKGFNTLWQPGTDHAGIATQMLVERKLLSEGIKRTELGREKFIDKIWEWKEQSGGNISRQLRRMGASVDWQRERFTMDKEMSAAVTEVFVRLYREGLIYRGKRLVNWDPKLLSAISDLEVINKEEKGFLYTVRYPFVDGEVAGKKHLLIATTRPETILADGALAVNPADERYAPFIGKMVWVPMTDRKIPVIRDEYVDPEFGTGCVKITPAHDFNDYQVGQRHQMEIINLFTPDAMMNDNAPEKYHGLDRFAAREVIIEDLRQAKLLEKIDDHLMKRPYGDRSGVVIEPYLTDQWFVKAETLAEKAIQVVKEEKIEFVPKNWENTYFQWLENIQDWCISRQLWWGHRIPVWYKEDGSYIVANDEQEAKKIAQEEGYQGTLQQDDDVLDTWFSSALWPFSTLGWPNNTEALKTFYPTSVLVTGFDIIFFWVARMIMFGVHFTGEVPFKQVYVHGLVRDGKGDKMSKSKGNVLDPTDIIDGVSLDTLLEKRTSGLMQHHLLEKIIKDTKTEFPQGIPTYGCDALRFTFIAMTSTGRDIRFELNRCEGYRNFCNKLWNSARFSIMKVQQVADTPNATPITEEDQQMLSLCNSWIESRLHQTINEMEQYIAKYRFDLMASTLYDFVWHDFCDWYIEMIKPFINKYENAETLNTLLATLESICRLAHPVVPFITEEIWQQLPRSEQGNAQPTIMCQPYPVFQKNNINQKVEEQINWLKDFITTVRSLRAKNQIKPSAKITLLLENTETQDQQYHHQFSTLILLLCNAEQCTISQSQDEKLGMTGLCRHFKVTIPFDGTVDLSTEIARIKKELAQLEKQATQLSAKLNNPNYTDKAPAEVVEKTQQKYQLVNHRKKELEEQLLKLQK